MSNIQKNMNIAYFDRNKPFNELPLLPPSGEPENDTEVLKKLVSASRALSSVNTALKRLPNPYMLINTIGIQEARSSTEIENIFTTEDELFKAISDTRKEEQADRATREVLRYREALWAGYNVINDKGPLNIGVVIDIASKIKDINLGIRPPQARVVIRRGDSEFRAGEVVYTPPRGEGVVEKLIHNLFDYINNNIGPETDPLVKMCIAHYQFEAIHPFHDGNGRSGRILNLLYLVQAGLLTHPVLCLSRYIIDNKDSYYHYLSGVTQRRGWKQWILFMLDAVEATSINTCNKINDIADQMADTYAYATSRLGWYNRDLNEALFSQPYIKAHTVGAVLERTSRTTVTKYMGELVAAGILSPRKDGLEVYYLNNDLLRILGGD